MCNNLVLIISESLMRSVILVFEFDRLGDLGFLFYLSLSWVSIVWVRFSFSVFLLLPFHCYNPEASMLFYIVYGSFTLGSILLLLEFHSPKPTILLIALNSSQSNTFYPSTKNYISF